MKTYKDNKNQVNIIRGGCILFVKVRTDEEVASVERIGES